MAEHACNIPLLQVEQIKVNLCSLVNQYPHSLGPYRGAMSPTKRSDTGHGKIQRMLARIYAATVIVLNPMLME
jgi:hypothetical protein